MEEPIEIFCCYARKDQSLLNALKTHLSLLQRQDLITIWNDTDISPGVNYEEEIKKHLNTARIILLLISPDFMASNYCYSKEMRQAMERQMAGLARVIPVILRPVLWTAAPFGQLQALPTDAHPVVSSHWYSPDEAFLDIAVGIQKVVQELKEAFSPEEDSNKRSIARFWPDGIVSGQRIPLEATKGERLLDLDEDSASIDRFYERPPN